MLKNYPVLRVAGKTGACLEEVRRSLDDLVEFRPKPFFMGHRLGEFAHYPMNLNSLDRLAGYKETRDMLDEGFRNYGLSGLELDIRVKSERPVNGEAETVYVVHDELSSNLPEPCQDYLDRNRFDALLRHYIAKKYYETKLLGVELKGNKRWYDPARGLLTSDPEYESRLARAGVATVDRVCREMKLKKSVARQVRGSIAFACFHLSALEAAFAAGGEGFRFYLIATTDRFWSGFLNQLIWKNPPLRGAIIAEIAAADFLTGIWFDPIFYDRPLALFNEINRRRARKLHFFISTYYSGFERLKQLLAAEQGQPRLPVEALFFDLW